MMCAPLFLGAARMDGTQEKSQSKAFPRASSHPAAGDSPRPGAAASAAGAHASDTNKTRATMRAMRASFPDSPARPAGLPTRGLSRRPILSPAAITFGGSGKGCLDFSSLWTNHAGCFMR